MWALSTCGEPDEIKKDTHPKNITALFRDRARTLADSGSGVANKPSSGHRSRHVPLFTPIRPAVLKQAPALANTPASLRARYSVGDTVGVAKGNRMACTAFLKQHYHPADLSHFCKKYYPGCYGQFINVVGPDKGGIGAGVEASLDIEYITAMGGGVESEFWSFPGTVSRATTPSPLTHRARGGRKAEAESGKERRSERGWLGGGGSGGVHARTRARAHAFVCVCERARERER